MFEDGIAEDEAVRLALWNNAAFKEALADLGFSRADLVRAGMIPNPVLSLLFPFGPKQFEGTLGVPVEALWLRCSRLRIAEREAEAAAARLVSTGLDLVRDVRVVSADLSLARSRAELARAGVQLRRNLAGVFEARVRAGAEARSTSLMAENAVILAEVAVRQAESAVRLAEERLRGLTGTAFREPPVTFADAPPAPPVIAEDVPALLELALAARPDVRAAELGVEAAGLRAGLAPKESFTLSVLLDANGNGLKGYEMGPGIATVLPIFNQNDAGRADACARLEKAARHYVVVREAVVLDVRQSFEKLREATHALETWKGPVLAGLTRAADAAKSEHEHGESSRSLVLDAEIELHSAKLREAELEADVRRSRAELERAVGRRLGNAVPPASRPAGEEEGR